MHKRIQCISLGWVQCSQIQLQTSSLATPAPILTSRLRIQDVHIDIIMDKMFEALYIKYNHEAPIHSLKIVILARLNVKMLSIFPSHTRFSSSLQLVALSLLCGCKSQSNPNIFNIILLFGEYKQTHPLVCIYTESTCHWTQNELI